VRATPNSAHTASNLDYDDVATGIDGARVAATVAGTQASRVAPAILKGAAASAVAAPARAYMPE
jgi:hypothetical protein